MTPQGPHTENDIRREVKRVIAMVAECNPEEISDAATFAEDLQIDSLSAMEILVGVEKRYKIEIPEKEFTEIKTVNDAVDATLRCLEQKAREAGA